MLINYGHMYEHKNAMTNFVTENSGEIYQEEDFPEVKVEHQVNLLVDSYLMPEVLYTF